MFLILHVFSQTLIYYQYMFIQILTLKRVFSDKQERLIKKVNEEKDLFIYHRQLILLVNKDIR